VNTAPVERKRTAEGSPTAATASAVIELVAAALCAVAVFLVFRLVLPFQKEKDRLRRNF
jgi:dolichol kinase